MDAKAGPPHPLAPLHPHHLHGGPQDPCPEAVGEHITNCGLALGASVSVAATSTGTTASTGGGRTDQKANAVCKP